MVSSDSDTSSGPMFWSPGRVIQDGFSAENQDNLGWLCFAVEVPWNRSLNHYRRKVHKRGKDVCETLAQVLAAPANRGRKWSLYHQVLAGSRDHNFSGKEGCVVISPLSVKCHEKNTKKNSKKKVKRKKIKEIAKRNQRNLKRKEKLKKNSVKEWKNKKDMRFRLLM